MYIKEVRKCITINNVNINMQRCIDHLIGFNLWQTSILPYHAINMQGNAVLVFAHTKIYTVDALLSIDIYTVYTCIHLGYHVSNSLWFPGEIGRFVG